MEEWVDELRSLHEESRQLVLHRCVDEIVLVRGDLKVLFQLYRYRCELTE